jgi:agmatine/peptidylarginine deiminase
MLNRAKKERKQDGIVWGGGMAVDVKEVCLSTWNCLERSSRVPWFLKA